MSRVCFAFQKGDCQRGADCRFSHDSNATGSSDAPARRPAGVCFAFQKGECDRGNSCRFTHDSDSDAAPAFNSGFSGYNRSSPRSSPRSGAAGPCYAHQRGECERGESCRFSHGDDAPSGREFSGFRQSSNRSPRSGSSGVCFAFQKGECERGESCRFAHETGEGSAPKPQGVCFAHQKGECQRGDSCRFSHEAAPVDEFNSGF